MLWLKRCVVATLPHEAIVTNVVYLAVLLAHGRSFSTLCHGRLSLEQTLSVVSKLLQCAG